MKSQENQGGGRLPKFLRIISPYFICYSLWMITTALAFLNMIVARKLYLVILTALSVRPWSIAAIDKILFILIGLIWLAMVIFSEYYYRGGISVDRLWKRFSLITGIQLLFLFVAQLIPILLFGERLIWIDYVATIGELGGGIFLLIIARPWSEGDTVRTFRKRDKPG